MNADELPAEAEQGGGDEGAQQQDEELAGRDVDGGGPPMDVGINLAVEQAAQAAALPIHLDVLGLLKQRQALEMSEREKAMREFVVPEGYERCIVPTKSKLRSGLYDLGIKAQKTSEKDSKKPVMVFFCFANKKCREATAKDPLNKCLSISATSMSTYSDHCKRFHDFEPIGLQKKKHNDDNNGDEEPPLKKAAKPAAAGASALTIPKPQAYGEGRSREIQPHLVHEDVYYQTVHPFRIRRQ